jgi:hypothetical protein
MRSARPSRRDVPLAAATNRYRATERKGEPMTSERPFMSSAAFPFAFFAFLCGSVHLCQSPVRHSFSGGGASICGPPAFPVRHSFSGGGCLLPSAFRLAQVPQIFAIIRYCSVLFDIMRKYFPASSELLTPHEARSGLRFGGRRLARLPGRGRGRPLRRAMFWLDSADGPGRMCAC